MYVDPPVIRREPVPGLVVSGRSTELNCEADGNPPITYEWYKVHQHQCTYCTLPAALYALLAICRPSGCTVLSGVVVVVVGVCNRSQMRTSKYTRLFFWCEYRS